MRWLGSILIVLALIGCSGSTGQVGTSIGAYTAPFLAIDLASGRLESYVSLDEAAIRTDPVWKTSKILFRRIETGGVIGQTTTTLGGDDDEPVPQAVTSTVMFFAVFELTQQQWTALGGTARWLEPGLRAAGGSVVAAHAPAFGLSRDEIASVLSSFNRGRQERLALPTNDQWETACRGGVTGTTFWWGDDPTAADAVTQLRAVVSEDIGSQTGPHIVDAQRLANPVGLYDMHGNVWEWVDSTQGTVRGGSWNDTVSLARAANRLALDQSTHHPLVGARLILIP